MKVEYPFNKKYTAAYLVTNPEGRKNVCLVADEHRTTVSYGRYLMSVKLERILSEDELVWHIDKDLDNYKLDNLEVVTRSQHRERTNRDKGRLIAIIECPSCSEVFTIRKGNSQAIPSNRGKVKFCSMSCFRSFGVNDYTKKELTDISAKSLLDVKRIYE